MPYFDENMAPDVQGVLDTSAVLEITEFEVFRIAHREWFGQEVGDADIEPYFTRYMFQEQVPFWVRHFTHHVTELEKRGVLDPRQFGIQPRRYSASMAARGMRYLIIIVMVVATLVIVAQVTARLWRGGSCFLPPCY